MVKRALEWLKNNSKWYRDEYRKAYIFFQTIAFVGILVLLALILFLNYVDGVSIDKDNWIKIVMIVDCIVIVIVESISGTIVVVDGYEKIREE